MSYQRERLIDDLKKFVCEVRFKKANGEMRVMKCPLRPSYMPQLTEEQMKKLTLYKSPSIKPFLISKWLEQYPQYGKSFFLHDADIIFRELPDFDKLMNDDIHYLNQSQEFQVASLAAQHQDQLVALEKSACVHP